MSESKFLTLLNLSPEERLNPPKTIGRLKTVNEWASAAIDAVKDNADFLAAIKVVSPWAEAAFSAAKDTLGPLKFLVKLFEELTKIQDPEDLARLACTLAYQAAAEKAIASVGPPAHSTNGGPKFDDSVDDVDFSSFTLKQVVSHTFVAKADRILQHYLPQGGFSPEQVDRVIREIHDNLPSQLNALLSHGKSKDKFDPLFRWLQLPDEGRLSRAALRRHADFVSWVFNKAPVLQCEPYALGHICIEAECSKLTHGQLRIVETPGNRRPNPFAEGNENGGRHSLLETVMSYIADPKFRDAIVIQGSAGCGKSTFTLRLADHLRQEGLRPIRIRLRDVVLGKEFYSQMGEALLYEDDGYLRDHERFVPGPDPLQNGTIFQEELRYFKGRVPICPYVLILDGWDEISVAVSEGFKQRVKELLLRIRSELFRSGRPVVRVVLTGRPSDAIDECTEFFRDETPVLTVRTLNPEQLPSYATKLREATERKPLQYEGVSNWKFPDDDVLKPVFERYQQEFSSSASTPGDAEIVNTGVTAVLGYPLLLHFTFRLLAETNIDRKELIESPAALLRRLTDYATLGADKPSDRQQGTKIQARLSGSDLRVLLRRTAAHMTALGQESISKAELEKRLRTSDLIGYVREVSKDKLISALLVSFYFRGGNTSLGCEFTHKAFREYLFAEEIVETLKAHGRDLPDDLPDRPPSLYWKDYDKTDPREKASTTLAALLAPQWLSPEVVRNLGSLLEWEIRRTFSKNGTPRSEGETSAATPDEWRRVRTLLAELWGWWADGVHLRPQPGEDENTGQVKWDPSLAERMVPRCGPLTTSSLGSPQEPVRTITLDAHLGDALFRLSSWVHWHLRHHSGHETIAPRPRYQSLDQGKVMFRPTGTNAIYFGLLCHRISAAGWRPDGPFPSHVFARGIDFDQTDLGHLSFDEADLMSSSFRGATIWLCIFYSTNLRRSVFSSASVDGSSFVYAHLDKADFSGTRLISNNFIGASLVDVSFDGANLGQMTYYILRNTKRLPVPPNDFSGAFGIDVSDPIFSDSILSDTSMSDLPKSNDSQPRTPASTKRLRRS